MKRLVLKSILVIVFFYSSIQLSIAGDYLIKVDSIHSEGKYNHKEVVEKDAYLSLHLPEDELEGWCNYRVENEFSAEVFSKTYLVYMNTQKYGDGTFTYKMRNKEGDLFYLTISDLDLSEFGEKVVVVFYDIKYKEADIIYGIKSTINYAED